MPDRFSVIAKFVFLFLFLLIRGAARPLVNPRGAREALQLLGWHGIVRVTGPDPFGSTSTLDGLINRLESLYTSQKMMHRY